MPAATKQRCARRAVSGFLGEGSGVDGDRADPGCPDLPRHHDFQRAGQAG